MEVDDRAWIDCRPCGGEGVIEHLADNRPPDLCTACKGTGGTLAVP